MTLWTLLSRFARRATLLGVFFAALQVFAQEPTGAYITAPTTDLTVNIGSTVAFSGGSTYGTRHSWAFGDGTTALGLNVSKAFTVAGTFTVTLTATAAGYDSSSDIRIITVKPVAVTLTPTTAALTVGGLKQFAASVTGTTNTGITWSCTAGGGTITTGGLYTAPATPGTYTVTATSVADATKKATATVTVTYAPVTISVSPTTPQLTYGQNQTFTATVSGGNGNTGVTWTCTAGTITTGGVYTAPSTTGTYTVTAKAVADTTKTASATVQVAAPVSVALSPKTVTLVYGQTQAFTATVAGGFSGTSVTWSCTGGTVNAAGTYTAPSTAGTYTVKATSVGDVSKSDSATVTVVAPASVSISPTSVALVQGQQQIFTATAAGGVGTPGVTWSCTGGTVTTAGLYTAPSTVGTYTVTATHTWDTSKKATATVTVTTANVVTGVTVSPTSVTLDGGQGQTFTATVQGTGTINQSVTWSTSAGAITTAGAFTAPGTAGTVTVTATSVQDPTRKATATVTVRTLIWEADIIYVGTKEVAEVDAAGLHITHVDHLGSPRLVTGPTGQVESRQKYMPYGELADASGAYAPKKGYTNHEQTDPSGLIYMQARFYLPMYGRFASPDPARDQHFELTQSWNIYSYVRNSPVMITDPTGLASHENLSTHRETGAQYSGMDIDPYAGLTSEVRQAVADQEKWIQDTLWARASSSEGTETQSTDSYTQSGKGQTDCRSCHVTKQSPSEPTITFSNSVSESDKVALLGALGVLRMDREGRKILSSYDPKNLTLTTNNNEVPKTDAEKKVNPGPAFFDSNTNTVSINVQFVLSGKLKVITAKGIEPAPLTIVLGHEIAHGIGKGVFRSIDSGPAKNPMDHVNRWENPLRRSLGYDDRLVY